MLDYHDMGYFLQTIPIFLNSFHRIHRKMSRQGREDDGHGSVRLLGIDRRWSRQGLVD